LPKKAYISLTSPIGMSPREKKRNLEQDILEGERVSRREALSTAGKVAISAIVAGVVAGVGGYLAGSAAVPPPKTVTETVAGKTVTVTAPAKTVTTTVTGPAPPAKTVTTTVTSTATAPGAPAEIAATAWAIGPDPPSEYRYKNFEIAAERLNKMLGTMGITTRVKVSGQFFVRPVEWEEYRKKFYLAFKAGEAPDIYLTGHEDVGFLAENNYIIPLDDYIKEYEDTTYYDIIPTLWDACKYKGKTWAVPQDTEVRPLYFRKDVLRKLGWSEDEIEEFPEKIRKAEITLDDILEIAKEAVDKGLVERGLVHRVKEGYDYLQFYLGYGGRLWDPAAGKMVFSKKAWEKTLDWFYRAVYEYKVILPTQFSGDWDKDFHEPATKGTTLFISGGSWHKGEWVKKGLLSEDEFWKVMGYALHPAGEPGKSPVTLSHPLIYTVTTQAKERGKADIAAMLITLVTDPHLNSIHAVESTHLAILYSEINDSRYTKDRFLHDVAYMLDYTTFIPSHPKWSDYSRTVFTVLRAVETGDMKPDEAYDTLLSELQKALGDALKVED